MKLCEEPGSNSPNSNVDNVNLHHRSLYTPSPTLLIDPELGKETLVVSEANTLATASTPKAIRPNMLKVLDCSTPKHPAYILYRIFRFTIIGAIKRFQVFAEHKYTTGKHKQLNDHMRMVQVVSLDTDFVIF